MKKIFFLLFILILSDCAFSQGDWTQKADFGGTARTGAVGFSIGTKGYIGTGWDSIPLPLQTSSFWEWDGDSSSPTYNTWTQKANFGGFGRANAVGFSIGTKGYIGTGVEYIMFQLYGTTSDFWEWDGDPSSPTYNTWTKMANFGGFGRMDAVGFSIGTKGYIGTGSTGNLTKDLWEWDGSPSSPTYNTWTQKADVNYRSQAVGFSIGTKGYIGMGRVGFNSNANDFWEWDGDPLSPAYNTWTQKANFGGTGRRKAVGFSIGTKGYVGTGEDSSGYKKDFWEYNPTINSWTQKTDFAGMARTEAVGFSIGNKGYVGTGYQSTGISSDFWEFDLNAISVEEYENEVQVNIFPNPFSETTTLVIQSSKFKVQDLELKIFDIKGEEVYHQIVRNANEFIVRRNNLLSGIYFYSVSVNKKIIATGKIVIIDK